jgi:hypothetical protein
MGGVTLTLDKDGTMTEALSWTEAGATITVQDLNGNFTSESDGNCIMMAPALVVVDVSGVGCTVKRAEVDIVDGCGSACTHAAAQDASGVTITTASNSGTGFQTLTVGNTGESVLSVTAQSFEGMVCEIRLY